MAETASNQPAITAAIPLKIPAAAIAAMEQFGSKFRRLEQQLLRANQTAGTGGIRSNSAGSFLINSPASYYINSASSSYITSAG